VQRAIELLDILQESKCLFAPLQLPVICQWSKCWKNWLCFAV